MKQNIKSADIINNVVKILSKNEYRKNRYENDIQWLEDRREYASVNKVKVAIIGVTSSGKSTLVNALLGEKILPVSIKPSSSIVITCSKGATKKAVIYFRNGQSLYITENELNEDIIKKYADESENEKNKYEVQQIDIMTPSFVFGDNIQIIDSPGLDACNLEMHEKLTLEILLPTIDICVFLTTVKASSDAVNKDKIMTVLERNKEIILVQNMIDSVEPKIGKNGIILESEDDILKKHKERALNLLESCNISRNSCNDIVQISALYALKAIEEKNQKAYELSNIDLFIDAVNRAVINIYPKIENSRMLSVNKRIHMIIETDDTIIKNRNAKRIVNNYEIDNLVSKFQKCRNLISDKINDIDKITELTINKIRDEKSNEIGNYLEIVWQVNKESLHIEQEILKIVKECESEKIDIYRKLNLDIKESYVFPSDGISGLEIEDIKMKHEIKSRLVKKEGKLNKGKRFVSTLFNKQWGYDEERYDEDIVDKDAIIKRAEEICSKNKGRYISILYDWSSNYSHCINNIYAAVKENRENIKQKQSADYNIDEIRSVYYELLELQKIILDCDETATDISREFFNIKEVNKISEVIVKKTYFDMFKFANVFFEKNYYAVRKYINSEKINEVFWLYDCSLGLQFLYRMHGISLSEEEVGILYSDGYYIKDNITLIFENCINRDDLYNTLQYVAGKKYHMYCMINAIQISSTEKHILNSVFLNQFLFRNEVKMHIVIDSSREFINADIIKELLGDVFELKKHIKKVYNIEKMGYILMNSRNPIYNVTLIECQNREKLILSSYKDIKERILDNMLSRGTEERKNIEEILLYFMKCTEDNKGE